MMKTVVSVGILSLISFNIGGNLLIPVFIYRKHYCYPSIFGCITLVLSLCIPLFSGYIFTSRACCLFKYTITQIYEIKPETQINKKPLLSQGLKTKKHPVVNSCQVFGVRLPFLPDGFGGVKPKSFCNWLCNE